MPEITVEPTSVGLEKGSLEAAAAAIAKRREAPDPDKGTSGAGKPAEADPDETQVAADPLGIGDDPLESEAGSENGGEEGEEVDSPDLDGEEGEETATGAGDAVPRSILDTASDEELERKFHIPTGLAGELEEISLRELVRGNLREADYTRKTMQVKQIAQLHVQGRDLYQMMLPILSEQIQAGLGVRSEEQWQALFDENPRQYALERDKERINKEKLTLLQRNAAEIDEERANEAQYAQQQHVITEANKLRGKLRHLKDQTAVAGFAKEVSDYLKSHPDIRASDEDVSSILDHRAFIVIADAMKWRKLMESKRTAQGKQVGPKVVAQVLKPGVRVAASVASSAQKKVDRARSEHHKAGSIESAAALMAARRVAAMRTAKKR